MKLKNLPIGQSSFENIIKNNQIYVDKTKRIYELITSTQFNFLSRPRRFGKSLLVSTLKNIFLGNKDLFKGLWIYNSDWEWEKHPVIVIDFNSIVTDTVENLIYSIGKCFDNKAKEFGISLEESLLKLKFKELIVKVYERTKKEVIILVDEYDKPIISHLGEGEERLDIAKKNREVLKSLFGTMKDEQVISRLRFVLLTGVSKFSRAGVFSDLNNLNDISMDSIYSDILGITEDELEKYFHDYIKVCANEFGITYEKMKEKIKDHYNGYRFSRKNVKVYNPFSILNFFSKREIKNYWFESGTPTFLIKLIKDKNFYLPQAENLLVEESIFSTYELEHLNPSALLFQTGYLTIKDYDFETNEYVLSYPNKEVKYSFLKILYKSYVEEYDGENLYLKLGKYLRAGDVESFIETVKSIFAGISYSVGSKLNEANFHTIFYLMVNAGGTPAEMELLTCEGRIDMVVETKDRIYIMEFKCNQSAEKAIEQMKEKNYAEKYKNKGKEIILLGINFDTKKRNIADWKKFILSKF